MFCFKLLLLLFSIPLFCEATNLKPWFEADNEAEIHSSLLYQNYNSLATVSSFDVKPQANDVFLTLGIEYPFMRYCVEIEATAAHTHFQHTGWDCFRITGRYQVLNEIETNRLNLVAGIMVTEPFSRALHDISSFHSGHIEGEANIAIGKKYGFPFTDNYQFCWWNVFGVGIADIGEPWIREDFACEFNVDDVHSLRAILNTWWGTGKEDLYPDCFKGYGYIKHRSIDVGVRYGYDAGCYGTLSIEYARRVYAHNFPKNNNFVLLEYDYSFGSQVSASY